MGPSDPRIGILADVAHFSLRNMGASDGMRHPLAIGGRTSVAGITSGDRVRSRYTGLTGVVDEFLSDGDAFVSWDDGTFGTVKWRELIAWDDGSD